MGSQTYTANGTYTWICPAGVKKVNAACWGGGTGGQCGSPAGGIGGGAYAATTDIAVTAGTEYTVIVGAGSAGTGWASGHQPPSTAGGDSSFVGDAGATVLAKGGAASTFNNYGSAGGSAAASTGTVKYDGGWGNNGTGGGDSGGGGGAGGSTARGLPASATDTWAHGTGGAVGGGDGGDGFRNPGGSNTPPTPGVAPGGGGGSGNWGRAYGANGADGQVVLTWAVEAVLPAIVCHGAGII